MKEVGSITGLSSSRANAVQLENSNGISLPAVPVQRKIGSAGESAVGKKVKKTDGKIPRYKVKEARKKEDKWEYCLTLLPNLGDIWVDEDAAYDLVDEESKKELKEGQIAIEKSAIESGGKNIGGTKFSLSYSDTRIELAHENIKDLKCFIEFSFEEKKAGVKNMDCKPYNGSGLGTLLIAAFVFYCKSKNIDTITLSTDNTAPGFWARFGLSQSKDTKITDDLLDIKGPYIVMGMPPFQETYNH